MNQKLYSTFRLLLGIFILLGVMETGKTVVNQYQHSITTITHHSIVALQKHPKPLQRVAHYWSQLIDSTPKHLS